jgi:phospholipase C
MTGSRRRLVLLLTVTAVAIALLGSAATAGSAARPQSPRTPIEHFVMLMQEGHSFDNYFGRFPGADGIPRATCMPVDPRRERGRCVRPFHLGDRSAGLPHGRLAFEQHYADGQMNGFVSSLAGVGIEDPSVAMGYYDQRDIPFFWSVARQYVLFDRFFASAASGSVANHLYWLTGTPGDPAYPNAIPPAGFGSLPTIFDRLDARGISWKVYVEDYDPAITFRTAAKHERGTQATWMPLLSYARYVDDADLSRHIVDVRRLFTDADRGKLPAVAYVVPAGSSEHPPGSLQAGSRLVRRIVNAMTLGPEWASSAFMWTYDTWGGWYDHVKPPQVDRHGYGFRVPALLVSPYARRGEIVHTRLDHTSALRFIEDNWRLRPLASRDAHANTLIGAFDFTADPRPATILRPGGAPTARKRARRAVIYAGYGGATLLALALVGAAAAGTVPRRRRRHSRRWRGARH